MSYIGYEADNAGCDKWLSSDNEGRRTISMTCKLTANQQLQTRAGGTSLVGEEIYTF